ncbi:hypothetical protein ACFYWU_26845 [Streptomyces chrestomyceticus]|uniref:hypothetical protein n=1 Tax=Streptomyces chrestomyceticus TaxID=68185 RepID=UPI0036BC87C3
MEGYRPHRMEAHGFGPGELPRLRPGVVQASVNGLGPASLSGRVRAGTRSRRPSPGPAPSRETRRTAAVPN